MKYKSLTSRQLRSVCTAALLLLTGSLGIAHSQDKPAETTATAPTPSGQEKATADPKTDASIIRNGNMETDTKGKGWPDGWAHPKSGSYEKEEGNHFIRLVSSKPNEMVMIFQEYKLPPGLEALELKYRTRVTDIKKGKMPWYDSRIILEFRDAAGSTLSKPGTPAQGKDTKGWVEKSASFLVPEGAVRLVVMPTLFQVEKGTMDIDDVTLKPTDPAPLHAKAELDKKVAAERFVPPETPNPAKWPKMLKVVGNKVLDTDGKGVWLQGVNVGGMETLPQDTQPIKSALVALEQWNANCIRVPIKEEFWYGNSAYQKDGGKAYRENIDRIVTLCGNRGAYCVIDLHRFRAPKKEHADFWVDCATIYKDNPAVLFDIFNEPHDISWEVWQKGGFVALKKGGTDESAFLSAEDKKKNEGFESVGMQGLVDAVRSTGAKNIIIAGGLRWCNDLTGITKGYALDDKAGNGIMYSWHTYHWHKGWENVIPVVDKHPVFLGEVGSMKGKLSFIPEADQEDPFTWTPDMLGFIQKHKIHWTGWNFHPRSSPYLILDWTYKPTPAWGDMAKRALAGEQFELKKMR